MGFFKKSPPKTVSSNDLEVSVPNGWSTVEGEPCYLRIEGERAHKKTLQRLFESAGDNAIPVRLKYDPFNKSSVPVHSELGIVGDLNDEVSKSWIKKVNGAAENQKFYVGEIRLGMMSNGVVSIRDFWLSKANEVTIDLTGIEPKIMTEAQIQKAMSNLEEIAGLYPDTSAQIKSQAKKALKVVATLYAHCKALDEQNAPYKKSLTSLCADFNIECEQFADSENDLENEIGWFMDSFDECQTGTGSYAPRGLSAFEIMDGERLKNSPNLAILLEGKSIVLSGDFNVLSREDAVAAIKNRGGKSPSSVSKKTVALVVGALAGETKKAKALELNIPIVDEQQFLNILETGEISSSQ